MFGWDFFKYLPADSILSIANPQKGQEQWTDRQHTVGRPPNDQSIIRYLDTFKPDVVLFLETPFSMSVYRLCNQRGVKTVAIPMHETFSAKRLVPDLMICPNNIAYQKSQGKPRKLLFLPIGIEMFPYRKRTGHTFVCNIGYGGVHDRRQSAVIARAFSRLKDRSARLIMNSQYAWPQGSHISDNRITYNLKDYPSPADTYKKGDIALLPIAYGGYERSVLEAMASGMPTLTTAAEPMCLYQHDPDFLIEPCERYTITQDWVYNVAFNKISVDDLLKKLKWLMTIDTAKYSERARRQAEAQSWESTEIDYHGVWIDTLERLCRGK